MNDNDTSQSRAQARRKIIETAQLNCYEARSRCLRAKSRFGDVPRDHRLGFQDAILDYYWALKPLREADPVVNWWDNVELSGQWTVAGDGGDEAEPQAVTGLDSIDGLGDSAETTRYQKSTIRGRQTVEQTQQKILPFSVLKDISGVLDDAAGRLGFNPDTPMPDETDPEPI